MNELRTVPTVTEKELMEYLDVFGLTENLSSAEKISFLNVAKAYGLNPFKKEIYVTAYGEGKYRKCSIITGYEVYLKRAERSGKLNGWDTSFSGAGNSLTCRITIRRKDWDYLFSHEVYYSESVQYNKDGHPNSVWTKMPRTMLRKVAIGQGFRLCFSDELGGMPYLGEELIGEERDVTEELPPKPAAPEERRQLLMSIKEALETKNPDELPYFDKYDVKRWGDRVRELPRDASGIPALKEVSDLVKAHLDRLKAEYKPVPFEGDEPATSGAEAARLAAELEQNEEVQQHDDGYFPEKTDFN
jgi:phage recombination protein Bet